jgi:hypothetical protein
MSDSGSSTPGSWFSLDSLGEYGAESLLFEQGVRASVRQGVDMEVEAGEGLTEEKEKSGLDNLHRKVGRDISRDNKLIVPQK